MLDFAKLLAYPTSASDENLAMPSFHVYRSIQIDASPDKVFDAVADFGTWTTWSPWLSADPDAIVTVSDDPSSVGSVYSWQGELIGAGEMEHQRLELGRLIEDEIRIINPFRSKSKVTFELQPDNEDTKITWHMRGSLPWFMLWMVAKMEVFIGMDYERGLCMLKEWIETGQVQSETSVRGIESVGPLQMVGIRETCFISEIGSSMKTALEEVKQILTEHDLPSDGELITVYHKIDFKAQRFHYTTGILLASSLANVPEGLSSWSIPAMQALVVEHVGSYKHLGNGWNAAIQFARYKKLKQSKIGTYEIYKNGPDQTSPDKLCTEICLPLK
jgi:predicted transcriptional regulator YdeE